MKTLLVATALLCCSAVGQNTTGRFGYLRSVDETVFDSCSGVEVLALEVSRKIDDDVYFMQLFPKGRAPHVSIFGSEGYGQDATAWLLKHRPKEFPYAVFYFAKGSYTLRCRDTQGRSLEVTGPLGSPPLLKVPSGSAKIWHFYFTPINAAHVFVVTDAPLDALDGEALMAQVKERLNANYVYLYIRNDPWFLGEAPDPLPYIFTDSYQRMTEDEYRASRTMTCYSDSRCLVGPSVYN